MSSKIILAIESSCDETAIAIISSSASRLELLSNEISSQVKLHAKWGGVVPNLAAREHVKNITPLLKISLEKAGVAIDDIDAIAVTQGPGLIPALMVGVNFAKTLAYLRNKPLIGIHHIEGHIYANFISNEISVNSKFEIRNLKEKNSLIKNSKLKIKNSKTTFPALALVVSGGHTQLVLMKDHFKYEIVGQTLDDAVGEAFDKVARILNIGYPGGPVVAQQAANFKFQISNFKSISNDEISNNKNNTGYQIPNTKYQIHLPRPMINKPGFNFSFSGLKTAVLYETKNNPELPKDEKYIAEICHEFQQAAIDVLISKTIKAAEKFRPKTIMLAGGVSANKELRQQLGEAVKELDYLPNQSSPSYLIPDISLTGDNAAMIAAAAALRFEKMSAFKKRKTLNGWKNIQPDANLKLK